MQLKFAELKKFFLYTLVGALVASAGVAVVTVLIGSFNETSSRVFLTLLMVILHSLISLSFIWDDSRQKTFEKLAFFTNVLFFLIVLSFITSILGIWKIIIGDLVGKIYQTYFVIGFAALHSDILSKVLHKETYMDRIAYANFVFIILVVGMIMPTIYVKDSFEVLGESYYRVLGALGIIDGTLSILAIIFYKLYIHKHPEAQNVLAGGSQAGDTKKKGFGIWVWILLIYLIFQIISSLAFGAGKIFK